MPQQVHQFLDLTTYAPVQEPTDICIDASGPTKEPYGSSHLLMFVASCLLVAQLDRLICIQ